MGGQPNTSLGASANGYGEPRGEDLSEEVDGGELTETLYYEIVYSETEGVVLQPSSRDASSAGRSLEAMRAFHKVLIAETHGRIPSQVVRSVPDDREIAIHMYVTHNVVGFFRELLVEVLQKRRENTASQLVTDFLEQLQQHSKVVLVMESGCPMVLL